MSENGVLWSSKKRWCLFALPFTFTTYTLTNNALITKTGFLNQTIEEIKLYRIRDFTVKRSLFQRIFGLGTVHICSADTTTPEFDVVNVKDCVHVKDMISEAAEIAKKDSKISISEIVPTKGVEH